MLKYITTLLFTALSVVFFHCEKPILPQEAIFNNPYDPDSPFFNDTLYPGRWQPLYLYNAVGNMLLHRIGVELDSKYYLLGGNNSAGKTSNEVGVVYFETDTSNDTFAYYEVEWPMIKQRESGCAVSVGTTIFTFGGDTTGTVEMFISSSKKWFFLNTLPTNKISFGAFAVNYRDTIIIGGGHSFDNACATNLYLFIPGQNIWKEYTLLPHALIYSSAAVVDSQLYIIGGFDSLGIPSSVINILNLNTKSWTIFPDTLATARGRSACIVRNDRILVIGGETSINPEIPVGSVDEIVLKFQQCVSRAELTKPLCPYGAFLYNKNIYFTGGYSNTELHLLRLSIP